MANNSWQSIYRDSVSEDNDQASSLINDIITYIEDNWSDARDERLSNLSFAGDQIGEYKNNESWKKIYHDVVTEDDDRMKSLKDDIITYIKNNWSNVQNKRVSSFSKAYNQIAKSD